MTGSETAGESAPDPLLSWESIPGAGGSRSERDGGAAETEAAVSAYEQVRGLLTEPGPRVGDGRLSEKMAEEMESFDQRWSQRPVSSLVAAGKKMVDAGDSTGLGRLLGLAAPTGNAPDADQETNRAPAAEGTIAETTGHEEEVHGDDEHQAEIATVEPVAEQATVAEDVDDLPEQPIAESIRPSVVDEGSPLTPPAGSRLATAHAAYRALNPLEVEVFLDQAQLLDREQAVRAASRSQQRALDTLSGYESRIHDLQRELDTERARSAAAAEDAATAVAAMTARVGVLEARIEVATTEIETLRRGDADDSEGGAGRQLIKGSDDLRPADDDEQPITEDATEDTPDDAVEDDDTHSRQDADVDAHLPHEEAVAEAATEKPDEGGSALLDALDRLSSGEDGTTARGGFGE